MNGLDLARPEWLAPGCALLAAVAALLLAGRRRLETRRARLLGPRAPTTRALMRLGTRASRWLGRSDLLLLGALALLVLALLGPRLGTESVRIPSRGIDVVLLLDVSRSMDSDDVPPSRLARARRAAQNLLAGLGAGDRAALAVFAGHGAVLTPLTPDKAALSDLLSFVDSEVHSDRSSRLESGLTAALDGFEARSARPRRVLVLSDGEHAGSVSAETLGALRRAGVQVVAAAIGTEQGGRIPTRRGPLEDGQGRAVTTRRDAAALERIASDTGGQLLLSDAFGEIESGALGQALRKGARPTADGHTVQEIPVTRTRVPAAIALLLLCAEASPRRLRMPRMRRRRVAATAALAASLIAAGGAGPEVDDLEARLRRTPDDVHLLLELGVTRAREGSMREAERAFLAAAVRARDPDMASLAYYDLGVALLSRGHYEGARDAFFDALAFDPGHEKARFNLEWTLRALASQMPPMGQGDDGDPEQDPSDSDGDSRDRAETPPTEPDRQSPAQRERDDESRRAQAPSPLSAKEAARWLEAARDDPSRALRAAAREGRTPGPGRGPRW